MAFFDVLKKGVQGASGIQAREEVSNKSMAKSFGTLKKKGLVLTRQQVGDIKLSVGNIHKFKAQADKLTVTKRKVAFSINNIVKNFEEFSDDIKRHPWKLLFKTKDDPKKNNTLNKEAR